VSCPRLADRASGRGKLCEPQCLQAQNVNECLRTNQSGITATGITPNQLCEHCEGIISHERWCPTLNPVASYACKVVVSPDALTIRDAITTLWVLSGDHRQSRTQARSKGYGLTLCPRNMTLHRHVLKRIRKLDATATTHLYVLPFRQRYFDCIQRVSLMRQGGEGRSRR
jgi:hypothetical protein